MITRYRAWLDGQPLDGIAESIFILDIDEHAPQMRIATADKPGASGVHLLREKRQALMMTIVLAIRERRIEKRQEVLDRVRQWCAGRVLTTNTRPGKRLQVRCSTMPTISSAMAWTESISVTFTAYELPWWEAEYASEIHVENVASDERTLNIPGTADTVLECDIKRVGPTVMNPVRITAGGSMIELKGTGLAQNETLHVTHDEAGRLVLRIDGSDNPRTVYNCLTPESSDDLVIGPGAVKVKFESGTLPADLTWRYRARWR